METSEKLLTVPQAAKVAGYTEVTIRRWILNGRLETLQYMPGYRHRIEHSALMAALSQPKKSTSSKKK